MDKPGAWDVKPCPFCAGDARLIVDTDIPLGGVLYRVVCADRQCDGKSGDFVKAADAVAAWNRRLGMATE